MLDVESNKVDLSHMLHQNHVDLGTNPTNKMKMGYYGGYNIMVLE
jgi:hypothetical protein